MLKLVKPEQEVFARWFEESTRRQAEDRAWAEGGGVQAHRAQLDAMIPQLLPEPTHWGQVFIFGVLGRYDKRRGTFYGL